MRTTIYAVAAVAALSLAACHKSGSNANNDVANPGDSAPVNTVQDAAAGPVGMASAAMPKNAQDFVTAAAIGDMYEIEAGKIAQKRSTNAEVKKFAAEMVKAHTATSEGLKKAITESGQALTPPTALDDHFQGKIDDLNKADAKDFDKKYMNDQVDAHQGALDLMQRYANDGDVPALKTAAASTAPKVQEHYDMAKSLRDKVEGKSAANPTNSNTNPAAK